MATYDKLSDAGELRRLPQLALRVLQPALPAPVLEHVRAHLAETRFGALPTILLPLREATGTPAAGSRRDTRIEHLASLALVAQVVSLVARHQWHAFA